MLDQCLYQMFEQLKENLLYLHQTLKSNFELNTAGATANRLMSRSVCSLCLYKPRPECSFKGDLSSPISTPVMMV